MKTKIEIDSLVSSKEYKVLLKRRIHNTCYICQKRSGSYYADCSPAGAHSKGYHGSGKYIYTTKYREFKSWKYNRRRQYKE